MSQCKKKILSFHNEMMDIINDGGSPLWIAKDRIEEKILDFIHAAKTGQDNLSQLYGCLVLAHLEEYGSSRQILSERLDSIVKGEKSYILAKEKNKNYSKENVVFLAPDLYGIYYALNDHYAQKWSEEDYRLHKNGTFGNPVISKLIQVVDLNQNYSKPELLYSQYGVDNFTNKYDNGLCKKLQAAFKENKVKAFSDLSVAHLGGRDLPYEEVVLGILSKHFRKFYNFSPDAMGEELNLKKAEKIVKADGKLDYVISGNVFNETSLVKLGHEGNRRDFAFASCARLLKVGGKAIHVMDKCNNEKHLNMILNRSLHKHVGQELIYSFYRDKSINDVYIERKDPDYANVPGYRKTSLMIMLQSKEASFDEKSLIDLMSAMSGYQGRFNFYNKEVYKDSKIGVDLTFR